MVSIFRFESLQGQGMITFIHLGKNMKAAEFNPFEDVILDTCCQNIVSSDEIWHIAVEMTVLLVTCIHGSNPRSSWYASLICGCFYLKSMMSSRDVSSYSINVLLISEMMPLTGVYLRMK